MNEAITTADTTEPSTSEFGRRLFVILSLVAVVLAVLATGFTIVSWRSGIFVVVTNQETSTLNDVVIHVTGESVRLGDILPGQVRRIKVHPTGESHVEVEFTEHDGKRHRLVLDSYFEPGYRGEFEINFSDDVFRYSNLLEPY